jgi:hypothetical protein
VTDNTVSLAQKKLALKWTRSERVGIIDWRSADMTIQKQAELLPGQLANAIIRSGIWRKYISAVVLPVASKL